MRTRALPDMPPNPKAKRKGDKSALSASARRVIARTAAALALTGGVTWR